jgi:beta-glucosidase-like glycosyl hydrolase
VFGLSYTNGCMKGGRNWEGFGGDPYLTGEGAYETILGLQEGGVTACAKHFVGK